MARGAVSQFDSQWLRRQHADSVDIVGNSEAVGESDSHIRTGGWRLRLLPLICWQRAVNQTSCDILQLTGARVVRQLATVTWRLRSGHQSDCVDLDVRSCRRTASKRCCTRRCCICVTSRHHRQMRWRQTWYRWLAVSMWQRVVMFLQHRHACILKTNAGDTQSRILYKKLKTTLETYSPDGTTITII